MTPIGLLFGGVFSFGFMWWLWPKFVAETPKHPPMRYASTSVRRRLYWRTLPLWQKAGIVLGLLAMVWFVFDTVFNRDSAMMVYLGLCATLGLLAFATQPMVDDGSDALRNHLAEPTRCGRCGQQWDPSLPQDERLRCN